MKRVVPLLAIVTLIVLSLLVLVSGCASSTIHSVDDKANYRYVFNDVGAPAPVVVHSHVERFRRSVVSIIPLRSRYNGNWEFELLASGNWLAEVKKDFTEIRFSDASPRQVPEWFAPSPDDFTAWKMQPTSYPVAHLFVEKNPPTPDRIRIFVRRH